MNIVPSPDKAPHWSVTVNDEGNALYCVMAEAVWREAVKHAYRPDEKQKMDNAKGLAACIANTRRVHNEAAAWELAMGLLFGAEAPGPKRIALKLHSIAGIVRDFALTVRDMANPFEGNTREWKAYLRSRELAPYEDTSSYNVDSAGVKAGTVPSLPRGQRPRKTTNQMETHLARLLKLATALGRTVAVKAHYRKGAPPATNRREWLDDLEIPAELHWDDVAFLHMHFIGLSLESIHEARVCWFLHGREAELEFPACILPSGAIVWLGPYYASLLGLARRRAKTRTKADPDPLMVFHQTRKRAKQRLDSSQHRQRVAALLGRPVKPMQLVYTGLAVILSRAAGYGVDYCMDTLGCHSHYMEQKLEDMQARVHDRVAEGTFLVQLDPRLPAAVAGFHVCIVCEQENQTRRTHCSECDAPLPHAPPTAIERAEWRLHRLLDSALHAAGNTHAGVEEAYAKIASELTNIGEENHGTPL